MLNVLLSGLTTYYDIFQRNLTIDGGSKFKNICKLVIWGKLIATCIDILYLTHQNVKLTEVGQTYMVQIMARDH